MHPIPPPNNISDVADEYTKKSPDLTGRDANSRTFFLNLHYIKFGTNDQIQAAAILFSLILLVIWAVLILFSLRSEDSVILNFITDKSALVWNAFIFVLGIAVGRSKEIKTHI